MEFNRKTDTVTVRGDTSTGGNNFYCYTKIPFVAGNTVIFGFLGTCGRGTPGCTSSSMVARPRVSTFDGGTCTQLTSNTGTVTYSIMKNGTITAFAEIHDSDNGRTTYSNLTIAGTRINFLSGQPHQ